MKQIKILDELPEFVISCPQCRQITEDLDEIQKWSTSRPFPNGSGLLGLDGVTVHCGFCNGLKIQLTDKGKALLLLLRLFAPGEIIPGSTTQVSEDVT